MFNAKSFHNQYGKGVIFCGRNANNTYFFDYMFQPEYNVIHTDAMTFRKPILLS